MNHDVIDIAALAIVAIASYLFGKKQERQRLTLALRNRAHSVMNESRKLNGGHATREATEVAAAYEATTLAIDNGEV